MALQPGTMLGPYEVLAQIGAGGMGEVYKGRDTRLDRIVAIKTLPAHLADLPELRERFEREAHALANLKHANICVLYDIGRQELEESEVRPVLSEAEGSQKPGEKQILRSAQDDQRREAGKRTVHYLVMEYLEGETLSERLKKGPLPVEQVLQFATEISAALDQAHRDGFTHRDIKPGNIMLVPLSGAGPKTGTKVLDFGLAKLKQEVVKATTPTSEMPTVPGGLTQHGTLLGTLQYMSPEQIEGKVAEIDGRTDVFAFGAVVYEMGTGKKAFPGETQASIIAKVLEVDPPPMSSLQPPGRMVPPALDRVVKRCLAKNREDRWQTMRDLCHELTWIREASAQGLLSQTAAGQAGAAGSGQVAPPVPLTLGDKLRAHLGWVAAAVILVAFLGSLAVLLPRTRSTPPTAPSIRFSIPEPENATFSGAGTNAAPLPAVSPDGLRVAFLSTGSAGGAETIWVRSLDSLTARMLPGTEGAFLPFWSPDSRYIGFFAEGKLKKIDISGGPPSPLSDWPIGNLTGGGTWNRDGVIVFSRAGGLFRVSAAGGEATPVTKTDVPRGESAHILPHFLPDGRHFLYLVRSSKPEVAGIYVASLDSAEGVRLLSANNKAEYSLGHILFLRESTLLAQPFDAARLELTGEPFPVAEQVGANVAGFGWTAFSLSDSGTLVFGPGTSQTTQLQWFDRSGRPVGAVGAPGDYYDPELSPDGRRVMVERTAELWVLETARGVSSRFTFDPAFDANANWSPDGSRIVFRSNRKGQMDLYLKPSSGVETEELLLESPAGKYPRDWSSDGKFIVYGDSSGQGGMDLWVLPLEGERKPFPLLQTDFHEDHAQLSPDGRWFAYVSNESGRYEVYIQSFPRPGGKWQVSTGGGIAPRWRGDGRELYYIAPDQKLMAVPLRGDATLEVAQPTALFQTRIFEAGVFVFSDKQQYDVTPDGQRFLINTPVEGAASPPLTVVLNWLSGVRK